MSEIREANLVPALTFGVRPSPTAASQNSVAAALIPRAGDGAELLLRISGFGFPAALGFRPSHFAPDFAPPPR